MPRKNIGAVLIVCALLAGVLGLVLWTQESDRAESRTTANEFGRAIASDEGLTFSPDDETANRTPAIGAWAVGGVLFLSGVIVLATTPSPPEHD